MRCLPRNRPSQLITPGPMVHRPRAGDAGSGMNFMAPPIVQAAPPVAPAVGTDATNGSPSRPMATARRRINTLLIVPRPPRRGRLDGPESAGGPQLGAEGEAGQRGAEDESQRGGEVAAPAAGAHGRHRRPPG